MLTTKFIKPFKHFYILDFLEAEELKSINLIFNSLEFHEKHTDLCRFLQTKELTFEIKLNNFKNRLLEFASANDIPTDHIDIFASYYTEGCYLLCHDDLVDGRRYAFSFYLDNYDEGELLMFNEQCDRVVKRISVISNTLVVFEVSNKSWHEVDYCSKPARKAITGWFNVTNKEQLKNNADTVVSIDFGKDLHGTRTNTNDRKDLQSNSSIDEFENLQIIGINDIGEPQTKDISSNDCIEDIKITEMSSNDMKYTQATGINYKDLQTAGKDSKINIYLQRYNKNSNIDSLRTTKNLQNHIVDMQPTSENQQYDFNTNEKRVPYNNFPFESNLIDYSGSKENGDSKTKINNKEDGNNKKNCNSKTNSNKKEYAHSKANSNSKENVYTEKNSNSEENSDIKKDGSSKEYGNNKTNNHIKTNSNIKEDGDSKENSNSKENEGSEYLKSFDKDRTRGSREGNHNDVLGDTNVLQDTFYRNESFSNKRIELELPHNFRYNFLRCQRLPFEVQEQEGSLTGPFSMKRIHMNDLQIPLFIDNFILLNEYSFIVKKSNYLLLNDVLNLDLEEDIVRLFYIKNFSSKESGTLTFIHRETGKQWYQIDSQDAGLYLLHNKDLIWFIERAKIDFYLHYWVFKEVTK